MTSMRFDRCNLHQLALDQVRAHGGEGLIGVTRIAQAGALAGACNFIDYAELPSGASIGRHRHAHDEEELYLVLDGEGVMSRDGEEFAVRGGDLVRNRAGGEHGLRNTGTSPLKLFVFELRVVP
jgi:mannose-6-phosphate isomerase-like protein (cupin superfamily)